MRLRELLPRLGALAAPTSWPADTLAGTEPDRDQVRAWYGYAARLPRHASAALAVPAARDLWTAARDFRPGHIDSGEAIGDARALIAAIVATIHAAAAGQSREWR